MRKNVWIPDDLYIKVSKKLRDEGRSFSSLVRDLLERYISEEQEERRETTPEPLSPNESKEEKKLPSWHGERKRVEELIRKGKIPKEIRERDVKVWMEKYKDLSTEDLLVEYQGAKWNIQCEAIERLLKERGVDISILCNYDRM
jgi:predicted CopG family antitoxin